MKLRSYTFLGWNFFKRTRFVVFYALIPFLLFCGHINSQYSKEFYVLSAVCLVILYVLIRLERLAISILFRYEAKPRQYMGEKIEIPFRKYGLWYSFMKRLIERDDVFLPGTYSFENGKIYI